MTLLPASLDKHRVATKDLASVCLGMVRYSPVKSLWFIGMSSAAVIGGLASFSWSALLLFVISTAIVLLFGHSLGSHRKLVHNSFQCTKWLEYSLVYLGGENPRRICFVSLVMIKKTLLVVI